MNGHKRNDVFMQAQGDGRAMQLKRVSHDFRPDAAATVALDSCRLVSMDISDRAT